MTRVKAKNLDLQFSNRTVLNDLSFEVQERDFILIQGDIGSGKSSLLKILSQDLKPTKGSLSFSCKRSEVSFVPQFRSSSFHLPVSLAEVVEFSTNSNSIKYSLLSDEIAKRAWNEASGGERTLCLLEAALQTKPKILLLDEILTWLDKESIELVLEVLVKLKESEVPVAIVMVEHKDLSVNFSKRWQLNNGTLLDAS